MTPRTTVKRSVNELFNTDRATAAAVPRRPWAVDQGNVTVQVALVVTVRTPSVLRPGAPFAAQLPLQ